MSEVAVAVAVAGWFGAAIGFHQATCEASETAVLTARTCAYAHGIGRSGGSSVKLCVLRILCRTHFQNVLKLCEAQACPSIHPSSVLCATF